MKLLFIQGGSRVTICTNGKKYVDGNFNNYIWKRYKTYCNDLTVILRKNKDEYVEDDIKGKLNYIDESLINLVMVKDIYKPRKKFLSINTKKNIKETIENEVKKADKVIIRSVGNFYTNTALKYCKKYKKSYLIEVTGFAFESLWYHSFFGKLIAIPRELKVKKSLKNAPFAVYVTEKALQKRYPCNGKTLGCSDVEISEVDDKVIKGRLNKIEEIDNTKKIVLGTAASLDVKFKGQLDVIKAIYLLKNEHDCNFTFEYQMIGAGNGKREKRLIKKLNLEDNVKILGAIPHKDVNKWLEKIDIYVHPSYSEGLCRSIVEAMSIGCPVICTNVGGNSELIDSNYIYRKRNIRALLKILNEIDKKKLSEESKKNYQVSLNYQANILDKKREDFYWRFINE